MGAIFFILFIAWLLKGTGKAMNHNCDAFRPDK